MLPPSRLPQTTCLIGTEPVSKSDAQVLNAPDPPNSRREFRAEKTGIGGLVGETPYRRESSVDGPWSEMAVLKIDAIPGNHDLIEREARL